MRHLGSAGLVLAFVLGGCGGTGQGNGAAGGNNHAAPASTNSTAAGGNAAAPASAPAGNASASAETPVGPCPFATRGWTAEVVPGEPPSVAMNGEIRPDAGGRLPMLSTQGEQRPPVYVLELISDPIVDPQADRGWMQHGGVFEGHRPAFTHASLRCGGAEIVRVPIRAE